MGGDSKWRKMKLALGLNTCIDVFKTSHNDNDESMPISSDDRHRKPTTPTRSSSGLMVSKSGVLSTSGQICSICLVPMKGANNHSIFTAECSHSFHFHCITSNVKHGNRTCPVCRAKLKETPLKNPNSYVQSTTNSNPWSQQDYTMVFPVGMPPPHAMHPNGNLLFQFQEPNIFDDDDELDVPIKEDILSSDYDYNQGIEVKTCPEVSTLARSSYYDDFGILINIKAPVIKQDINNASIDLVTVVDISTSMAGKKIMLLKQAMGFLVQKLGPSDRLSVIAFSCIATRLFPLRRMTDKGKEEALRVINSLVANNGTFIAEGLRKGTKVMTDRKFKNPVSSMILLSDGQDTVSIHSGFRADYRALLPGKKGETRIPIHTFGFGTDHDARALHFIAEDSGGVFSFIEAENVIQDAFAQCIGGLLSVVVQDLRVEVECVHPVLQLGRIKAGSYKAGMDESKRFGYIEVGDLYAEEERNFLVEMNIPVEESGHEMSLVKFKVTHKDPIYKTMVMSDGNGDVTISRPETTLGKEKVSIDVDRQRNRLRAALAIDEARKMAESGNLTSAVYLLEECKKSLADSVSGRFGDRLVVGLMAELREMRERMMTRRMYEYSGRAYVLSGLSSHSWQRATARGDSTELTSEIRTYQTRTMVDMINISHTMCLNPSPSTSMVNPHNNKKC